MDVLGQLVRDAVDGLPTDVYGEIVDEISDDDAAAIGQRHVKQTFKHKRSKSTCSRESTGSSGSSHTTGVSERWFGNRFKCDECPSVCSSERSLKEHVNKYHTRKEFECPVCQCGYHRSSGLQSHIQSLHPNLDVTKIEDPRRSLKQMKVWALQRENLALKRKIDEYEKLAKEEDSNVKTSQEEIESIRKEKEELQKTVEDLTESLTGKQIELDGISAKCQKLRADLKKTTAQLAERVEELKNVNEEKSKMGAEISELKEGSETKRQKLLEYLSQM